jgi:hypothetical protein
MLTLLLLGPVRSAVASTLAVGGTVPGSLAIVGLHGGAMKAPILELDANLDGVAGIAYTIELVGLNVNGRTDQWRTLSLAEVSGSSAAADLLLRHAPARLGSTSGSPEVEVTALQLAIWEVSYDSAWDLASGGFQVIEADPAAVALASTWLVALATPGLTLDVAPVRHGSFRDVIFVSNATLAVIPEPGTVALVGLGLGALLARRPRRP